MCQGRVHDGAVPFVESEDAQGTSDMFYGLSGHLRHLPRESISGSARVDVKDIDVGNGVSVNVPPGGRGPGQPRGPEPLSLEIVAKFRFL